ncbi:50S ribosomal protein L15 [bacterium]|nr:50S ribosomal protein L15 [bacterium]
MAKDLSNLQPAEGSVRNNRRRGRGVAAGRGGHTAGRGHKGQHSRSGSKKRAWFEGGQMPIQRRLPKRGFFNIFREEYQTINLRDLERLGEIVAITPEILAEKGLIKRADRPVKLLGVGEVEKKLNVEVTAVSAGAREKIETAGGTVTVPPPAPKKRGKYKKRSEREKA